MAQIAKSQPGREASFGFLIQTLSRRIDATMKERLQCHGVDFKIFANLMMLAEQDGINQRQLGAKLEFPEYYLSRNLDALIKAGYAERKPDPNSRRSQLIFLTQAGKDTAAQLRGEVKEVNDIYLSHLSEGEQRRVVELLQKVAKIAGEGR